MPRAWLQIYLQRDHDLDVTALLLSILYSTDTLRPSPVTRKGTAMTCIFGSRGMTLTLSSCEKLKNLGSHIGQHFINGGITISCGLNTPVEQL